MSKTQVPKSRIKSSRFSLSSMYFISRFSLRDQALFAKRLGLLVKAGVPLLESLKIMTRQSSGGSKKMFEEITTNVANGQFLSRSFASYKRAFGDFAINIIRVGETSGTLPENLKYLAEEIDKKRELRAKIVGALVYPIIIVVASLGVCGFLTLYLFPKLMPVFQSLRVDLPPMTKLLIWISNALTHYGLMIVSVCVVLAIGIFILCKYNKKCRYIVDRIALRIPVMGDVMRHYYLTTMCRTIGLLLKGQVRVLEAVKVAEETSTNMVYRREIQNLYTAVTKGSSMAKQLEKNSFLFPVMLTEMVSIGETVGNLSESLLYLADIYEQELGEKTKRLSSVIEPVMMLAMGLVVGFIAISIITPIYEVTQHLQPK